MYIYYRQCYRSLKPAAVFPIEVELGVNLDVKRYHCETTEEPVTAAELQAKDASSTDKSDEPLPSIDDLLLDLGLTDEAAASATPPTLPQTGGSGSEHSEKS